MYEQNPNNHNGADHQESKTTFFNTELFQSFSANKRDQQTLKTLGAFMPLPGMANEMLAGLSNILFLILNALALPAEILLRKDFGVRYLTIIQFSFAAGVTGGLWFLLSLFSDFGWLFWVYNAATTIMFWRHWFDIRKKIKNGILWHSESFGISRFEFLGGISKQFSLLPNVEFLDDFFLYRWVEPLLVILVAIVIKFFDPTMSLLLILVGLGLFLKAHILYDQGLNHIWDLIDNMIASEAMEKAFMGASKTEVNGMNFVRPPQAIQKQLLANASNIAQTVSEVMRKPTGGATSFAKEKDITLQKDNSDF